MRNAGAIFILFASLCYVATAQEVVPGREVVGAVTGRVICADTNLPARIASVSLLPVVDPAPLHPPKSATSEPLVAPPTTIAETLLDGTFTIPNVKPGNYYIVVEKLGYLSPLAQLSREELNHPTQETAAIMARLLTPVTVVANRATSTEVHILRGAAISGTIRFDDGSPDTGASVMIFRKDKLGKWTGFRTFIVGHPNADNTDDQGHYRIGGLPAGEYLVATDLQLSDIVVGNILSTTGFSWSTNDRYSLNIYFPDNTRQRDAKPVKLDEGQEANSIDIEIPLTKLHAVTGNVIEAGTGQTVNAGTVALVYPDDGSQLVSTQVSKEDDSFHFYYVPEGTFTIKVTNAREVTREEVPYPRGTVPPTHMVEKKIRDYGPMEQPIVIQSDMTGLNLTVPEKTATASAKAIP